MSQASLPALAPELKIQIFKSMDSFSSVANLSSTSCTFHNLWKSDAKSICDAVFQRTIECLPEAQVLLGAERPSQQAVDAQDLGTSQEGHDAFQQAILRSQRLLIDADTALSAFENFRYDIHEVLNYEMLEVSEFGRKLSPFERTHFVQAYYGAMTMVCSSREVIPESLIVSWDMLHFQRVKEFLYFLSKQNPKSLPKHIGIVAVDRDKPDNAWTIPLNFSIANYKMRVLNQDLLAITPSNYLFKHFGAPRSYFAAYEHLAKTTDSPGGVHLVELLRLLPEEALRRTLEVTFVRPVRLIRWGE